jgi:amino acid permease
VCVCVCTAVCSEGSIEAATVSLYQKIQMILLLLLSFSCTIVHCAYMRYGYHVVKDVTSRLLGSRSRLKC